MVGSDLPSKEFAAVMMDTFMYISTKCFHIHYTGCLCNHTHTRTHTLLSYYLSRNYFLPHLFRLPGQPAVAPSGYWNTPYFTGVSQSGI